ncbi:GNAT family N-acetyltransferase [Corynebacterium pacaense]|uniref:GNAT family N-acetyltransferase n=1 Tax=Corynebacterium pacaense TaxID=1816684 RepID=UPI0009BAD8F8|nr:GNAT family protein [Corynebacterium pacaense]
MRFEEVTIPVSGGEPPEALREFVFMANLAAQETTGDRDVSVSVERVTDDLLGSSESRSLLDTALDQRGDPAGWVRVSLPLVDDPTTASLEVVLDAGFQPLPGQPMEAGARELLGALLDHGQWRAAQAPWLRSVLHTAHMHPAGSSGHGCDHCLVLVERGYVLAHEEIQQILPVVSTDFGPEGLRVHRVVGTGIPAELIDGQVELQTIASTDVPHGALSTAAAPWSADRLAEQAERIARSGTGLVSVYFSDGSGVVATSSISIPPGANPGAAEQGLTIVHPRMRGRGLGTAIKLSCMSLLHERFPEINRVATSNAVDNPAMLAVNRALGARELSRTTLWEKRS